MKKIMYLIIIVFSLALNFISIDLVIEHGQQDSFSPINPSLFKSFFPHVMLLLLPLLSLAASSFVASWNPSNTSIKEKVTLAFLQMLMAQYLFILFWMLVTGFF